MKLVTLKSDTLKNYRQDKEMLQKAKRPCVLVISLKYKGIRHSFAVPLRSNINPSTPKEQYFPLPPRSVTKTKHRHGIHYIKMFPVKKTDCIYFRTKGNPMSERIKTIIDANEKQIIRECQLYLSNYEKGIHPAYSTDIDFLLSIMKE